MAAFMNVVHRRRLRERREVDHDFERLFRFNRDTVAYIADHFLGPESGETRGGALTKIKQVECFLRYIADLGFQMSAGKVVGVDRSTVCKTYKHVMEKIVDKAHLWIKFPTTPKEITQATNAWQEKYNFPNVIGAIDCTHVRITQPRNDLDSVHYINRKGFYSYNIQAVCKANEEFTNIVAEWAGCTHGSRILKNSPIPATLRVTNGIFF